MARGIRGSYKEKRALQEGVQIVEPKKAVVDDEIPNDDLQPYGSSSKDEEEGDEDEAPDSEKSAEVSGAVSAEVKAEVEVDSVSTPEFSFRFDKVPAGAGITVRVTRSDGKSTSFPHPNMRCADEFIRSQKEKLAKAAEARIHQNNLKKHQPAVFTPKYGGGVVESAPGELKITAVMGAKDTVVVIPEIAEEVLKWLAGRAVASWSVGDHGLRLVTHPDFKSLTFNWVGGHVHKS